MTMTGIKYGLRKYESRHKRHPIQRENLMVNKYINTKRKKNAELPVPVMVDQIYINLLLKITKNLAELPKQANKDVLKTSKTSENRGEKMPVQYLEKTKPSDISTVKQTCLS